MQKIDPERIARVARIYGSNQEASRALGIAPGSFSRLCRLYDIETPYARQRRRRQECSRRHRARRLLESLEGQDLDSLDLDLEELVEAQAELESAL